MNTRLNCLLSPLGMIDHFIGQGEMHSVKHLLDKTPDWQEIEHVLQAWRLTGEDFLLNALQTDEAGVR